MEVPIEQQFIDMMVPHHASAIAMAQLAGEFAEHAEVRQLSATGVFEATQVIVKHDENYVAPTGNALPTQAFHPGA